MANVLECLTEREKMTEDFEHIIILEQKIATFDSILNEIQKRIKNTEKELFHHQDRLLKISVEDDPLLFLAIDNKREKIREKLRDEKILLGERSCDLTRLYAQFHESYKDRERSTLFDEKNYIDNFYDFEKVKELSANGDFFSSHMWQLHTDDFSKVVGHFYLKHQILLFPESSPEEYLKQQIAILAWKIENTRDFYEEIESLDFFSRKQLPILIEQFTLARAFLKMKLHEIESEKIIERDGSPENECPLFSTVFIYSGLGGC